MNRLIAHQQRDKVLSIAKETVEDCKYTTAEVKLQIDSLAKALMGQVAENIIQSNSNSS